MYICIGYVLPGEQPASDTDDNDTSFKAPMGRSVNISIDGDSDPSSKSS